MEHGLAWLYIRWVSRAPTMGAIALFGVAAIALSFGCSSTSTARCGRSPACTQGTACIDDGTGSGPSCKKACTRQADCPFNWYCNDGPQNGQAQSWCVLGTSPVPQQAGQWGTQCSPSGGDTQNPACDTADGFACYGTSPADASAFCTLFDCMVDSDCPGGWWCAGVDAAPNVTTPNRTFGQPRTVCLPRQYCATCKMDHDCSGAPGGTQQHCVPDSQGSGFCAPQCATSGDCPTLDATCALAWPICAQTACATSADCPASPTAETCFAGTCRVACQRDADCPPSNGMPQHCGTGGACVPQACVSDDDCAPTATAFQHCNAGACTPECSGDADCNPGDQTCVPLSVCTPRAGLCVGDGSFCAPCRSDADCAAGGGYCLVSKYSKERFCSQPMKGGTTCSSSALAAGACPMRPATANYKVVACSVSADDFSPKNQCFGEVMFGTLNGMVQYAPGCWTENR